MCGCQNGKSVCGTSFLQVSSAQSDMRAQSAERCVEDESKFVEEATKESYGEDKSVSKIVDLIHDYLTLAPIAHPSQKIIRPILSMRVAKNRQEAKEQQAARLIQKIQRARVARRREQQQQRDVATVREEDVPKEQPEGHEEDNQIREQEEHKKKSRVPSNRFHMVLVEDDSCGEIEQDVDEERSRVQWYFRYNTGERHRIVGLNGTHVNKYWKDRESMKVDEDSSDPFGFPCILTLRSDNKNKLTEIQQAEAMKVEWQKWADLEKTEKRAGRMVCVDSFDKAYLMLCAQTNRCREVERIVNEFPMDAALKDLLLAQNDDGYTALMLAAENDCREVVELLVAAVPETDHVFHVGSPADQEGFEYRYDKNVKWDDLTSRPSYGGKDSFAISKTPLTLAVQSGHTEIVELLVKKLKDPALTNSQKSNSGLLFRDEIEHLEPDALEDRFNQTALIIALKQGENGISAEIAKMLIEKDPSPEHLHFQGNAGESALMLAARLGYVSVVEKLLEKDHSPEHLALKDDKGRTALHYAVHDPRADDVIPHKELAVPRYLHEHIEVVRLLASEYSIDLINHLDIDGHGVRYYLEKYLARATSLDSKPHIRLLKEMQNILKENKAWDFTHDQKCLHCLEEKKNMFEDEWIVLDCCGASCSCKSCALGKFRSNELDSKCGPGCGGQASKKMMEMKNKMVIPFRLPAGCHWKATLRATGEGTNKQYVHVEAVRAGFKISGKGHVQASEAVKQAVDKKRTNRVYRAMIQWLEQGTGVSDDFPHFDICETTEGGNWQIENVHRGHKDFGFAEGHGYFVADGDLVFGDSLQAFQNQFTTSVNAPCEGWVWLNFERLSHRLKAEATIYPCLYVKPNVTKKFVKATVDTTGKVHLEEVKVDTKPMLDIDAKIALEVEQVIARAFEKFTSKEILALQKVKKNDDDDELYKRLEDKVGNEIAEVRHKVKDIIRNCAGSTRSSSEPIKPSKCI